MFDDLGYGFGSWRGQQVCMTSLGRGLVPGEGSRCLTTLGRGLVAGGGNRFV